jgi:hypothetical protein
MWETIIKVILPLLKLGIEELLKSKKIGAGQLSTFISFYDAFTKDTSKSASLRRALKDLEE